LPVIENGKTGGQHPGSDAGPHPARSQDPDKVTVGDVMARPLPQLRDQRSFWMSVSATAGGEHGVLAVQDGKVWTSSRESI